MNKPSPDSGSSQKLFSPGPVPLKYATEINYSHRSGEFQVLYKEVSAKLCDLAGYKHVVLTQGSASSAVETVLSSVLTAESKILVLVNGEFGRRAAAMAAFYTQSVSQVATLAELLDKLEVENFDFCFVVQFETSLSIFNDLAAVQTVCVTKNVHLIADAVSAFPFYEPPKAKFLITSSSKQLRGLPALGVIFFDDITDLNLVERSNYLNLKRYIDYSLKNQTPHTSLMPQFDSLNQELTKLNVVELRKQIRSNALMLTSALENLVLNEPICPVVTLKIENAEVVVEKLRQAGISVYHNLFYMNYYIQVGCFNYDDSSVYAELGQLIASLTSEVRDSESVQGTR
jgi:aspartate aminotransferase-like enzyme